MRDREVRNAVLEFLRARHRGDPTTKLVEEMGVWNGSVRIDIAVINGELAGYELKSARDTLERLPVQASLYSQVFDRVTLVTAKRHLENAVRAIPDWWGVTLAVDVSDTLSENGNLALQEIRPAHLNSNIDGIQLARLLWRSEALAVLERYELARGVRGASVEKILSRLGQQLALTTLRDEVRETLKQRNGWLRQAVCH